MSSAEPKPYAFFAAFILLTGTAFMYTLPSKRATSNPIEPLKRMAPQFWFFDTSPRDGEPPWHCSSCPYSEEEYGAICPFYTESTHTSPGCEDPGLGDVGFIGLPKTGSIFMQDVLSKYAQEQMLWTRHDPEDQICNEGTAMGWHHATVWHQKKFVGADVFDNAFTFSVVRNPFSRQVSMYSYFTRRPGINAVYLGFAGMDEANYGRCFAASDEVEIQCFRIWAKRMHARYPPGSAHQFLFAGPPLGNPNGPPWFMGRASSKHAKAAGAAARKRAQKLASLTSAEGARYATPAGRERARRGQLLLADRRRQRPMHPLEC